MSNNTTSDDFGPYYSKYGAGRGFDALFLTVISVIGTLGNLLVISSIIYGRRTHKYGNIFLINLAVADLFVSCEDCLIFN